MKNAVYILGATDRHINRLISVGVDTLLVPAYNMPPAPHIGAMPSWDRIKQILIQYRGRVKLLLVPVWFQNWYSLRPDWQFVDVKGRPWPRTPCSSSVDYIAARFNVIERLQGAIDGVVWDLEDYKAPGVHDFFSLNDLPKCYCNRCNKLRSSGVNIERLFINTFNFRMKLWKHTGFTPYSSKWVRHLFPKSAVWYSQRTYDKNKYWDSYKKKLKGFPNDASAGIWLEHHKPSKLKKYIHGVMAEKPWHCGMKYKAGVWFYTHRWLNKKDIGEYYERI